MATSYYFQVLALPIMGSSELSNSGDFRRAFGACFNMSPNLCVHVWDEIEDVLPSATMIFYLLWVVFESIQNREYNGGDGLDDMENLQEMGKDCYRGYPFINICKLTVLFGWLVVTLS